MSQQEAEVWRALCLGLSAVVLVMATASTIILSLYLKQRKELRKVISTHGVKELLALRDIGAHRQNGKHGR